MLCSRNRYKFASRKQSGEKFRVRRAHYPVALGLKYRRRDVQRRDRRQPVAQIGFIKIFKAAAEVLGAGADKISTSSAVFRSPDMIGDLVKEFGADKVTVAIDVAQNSGMPSGYEVYIDGGRTATGADAIEWTRKVAGYGVKTILPTSKSTDGARTGYDLPLIRGIRAVTDADIVASGGAGTMEHFAEAAEAGATVLLAASVFHFGIIGIPELKAYLKERGFSVR